MIFYPGLWKNKFLKSLLGNVEVTEQTSYVETQDPYSLGWLGEHRNSVQIGKNKISWPIE